MVHALQDIWRVLVPGGLLIDLRPVADQWWVEVISDQGCQKVGRVQDIPTGLADDAAAFEALERLSAAGWFGLQQREAFDFLVYWDTPDEMQSDVSDKWGDSITFPAELITKIQAVWAATAMGSRVRIRLKLHIARWAKQMV